MEYQVAFFVIDHLKTMYDHSVETKLYTERNGKRIVLSPVSSSIIIFSTTVPVPVPIMNIPLFEKTVMIKRANSSSPYF